MPSTTNSNKSEALARARAWRDQRSPPRSAKKPADQNGIANESPRREPARSPQPPKPKEILSSATVSPKKEAKDKALARAREFAARLKEKKEQSKEGMDIDIDIDRNILAVINIEDQSLSTGSTTFSTAQEKEDSHVDMEEMNRIAADLKKLSERLEEATNKNMGGN